MNQFNDLGLKDVHATGIAGTCGCGGAAGACQCGGHADQAGHAPERIAAAGSAHHDTAGATQASDGLVRADYLVDGMTCAHCVSSVTEEVGALEGVESVSVELNAGGTSLVTVASPAPISVEGIRSALDEAGYTLVDAR